MSSTTVKQAPGQVGKSGTERRRSLRTPHVAEAWLASPTSTKPEDRLDAMSLNMSRHGVGFELACPLAVGTFYNIEIGIGEKTISSEVRIASCRKTEFGLYEVGAEFC